jgi:DNA-binding IclR family transcriptional regulator
MGRTASKVIGGRVKSGGIYRYKRILDQFTEQTSVWTVAALASELGVASSTLYRQVRELVAVGFLEATVDSRYRLGPAFVDMERRARQTDPLILAGNAFLDPLIRRMGFKCSALLARLYGNTVMCVADAHSRHMPLRTSFERGLPMPLVRTATARAVLSVMESRRLKRLLARETELEGEPLNKFLSELFQIRKQGFWIAEGELDPGAVAIAVPIAGRKLGFEASLSIFARKEDLPVAQRARAIRLLSATASEIEGFLAERVALANTAGT